MPNLLHAFRLHSCIPIPYISTHMIELLGSDFETKLAAGRRPRGSSDRCDPRALARTPQVDGDDCKDGGRKGIRECWEHRNVVELYLIRLYF